MSFAMVRLCLITAHRAADPARSLVGSLECRPDTLECGVIPPSPRARRERRKFDTLCPSGLGACAVDEVGKGGYECLDFDSSLENCGGCVNAGVGQDCSMIDGAVGIECIAGQCIASESSNQSTPRRAAHLHRCSVVRAWVHARFGWRLHSGLRESAPSVVRGQLLLRGCSPCALPCALSLRDRPGPVILNFTGSE